MSWASLHILKGWTDSASFQRGDSHSARLCLSIRHAEDCVRTLMPQGDRVVTLQRVPYRHRDRATADFADR